MERNILCDIQDAIRPVVLQTCIGDPRDDPKSVFLSPALHHSAIYTYIRNLCHPLLDQHDKDARNFLQSIVDLTHEQLDPRQIYSAISDDPDMNSYHPTSRQYAQALNHLIHHQQERMSMVFTSFNNHLRDIKAEMATHTVLFSLTHWTSQTSP